MARTVGDALRIMRLAIGRRNENDPDSNDSTLLQYLNDFATLTMSDDLKIFENYAVLDVEFNETVTDGEIDFPGNDTTNDFVNLSSQAMISLAEPEDESLSWTLLTVWHNPELFFRKWGYNNLDLLTTGMPTDVLFHENKFVFRTIPDDSYIARFFGYKKVADVFDSTTNELPFDYWFRYIAYGAAVNYARDYRYDPESLQLLERSFKKERRLILTRTHNHIKKDRCIPRF